MKYKTKEFDVRYFAGIEYPEGLKVGHPNTVGELWNDLFHKHLNNIPNQSSTEKFIGLECYPMDFMETKTLDYYAMVETNELITPPEGVVTKKLPQGKYICFDIEYDTISDGIKAAYKHVKENNIKTHMGFDFEDYIKGQDYSKKGAKLNFCFLLEE